jgi:hypothetical protein
MSFKWQKFFHQIMRLIDSLISKRE